MNEEGEIKAKQINRREPEQDDRQESSPVNKSVSLECTVATNNNTTNKKRDGDDGGGIPGLIGAASEPLHQSRFE